MSDAQPALIDYPTHYTFKAMGLAGAPFVHRIRVLVERVLGPLGDEACSERPSSAGKYISVSVHVFLRSEEQRRKIYEAFHCEPSIVWYV